MGIESPGHLLFIAVVALIVLGPRRLPGLARALGQGLREFREALGEGMAGERTRAPEATPATALVAADEAGRLSAPDQGAAEDERR